MDALRFVFFSAALWLLTGCQLGYYLSSGYNQMALLSQRVPIEKAIKDPNLSAEDKSKLELAQEARHFAENTLKLKPTKNYTSFVKLDRPYVTYVVSAAPKWKLEHYQWDYFWVGKMPYRGFFNEADAKKEQEKYDKMNYDTFLRGVSAYSTLGYFKDPILSSMLRYKNHDLVNTVIHESVHATIYIKNSADFNERLATFLGNKGTDLFYAQQKSEAGAKELEQIAAESKDEALFSEFISKEIKSLDEWYKQQTEQSEDVRKNRIKEIQTRFTTELKPKLRSESYKRFPEIELNNARLLVYKTYMEDLSDFEKLYQKVGGDFSLFIERCRSLEKHEKPEQGLKDLLN